MRVEMGSDPITSPPDPQNIITDKRQRIILRGIFLSHNLGHSGISGKLTEAKTMATVRDPQQPGDKGNCNY